MKIAFASEDSKGLESVISHHFGRCPYYVFVEVENGEVQSVTVKANPLYNEHIPGVVPQFVADEGANVIVAGGMGPRAIDWFKRLNVQPVTGVSGIVKDVLEKYLKGEISGAEPCDEHGINL